MGWNDRNPELYEALTGLRYEDDQPIGSPRNTMPAGWVPPAMPETCYGCEAIGDAVNDPLYTGECHKCETEMCSRCGTVEGDYGGNFYECKNCEEE